MLTKELIEKYLSGDITAEEQEIVVEYLSKENADPTLLRELLQAFDDESPAIGNYEERDQLLWQLRAKLYPAQEEVAEKRAATVWMKYAAVAAAIVLVLAAGTYYLFFNAADKDHALLTWHYYSNTSDTTQFVQLPDQSALWLKPHSSVKYQQGMNDLAERTIQLSGTGYLDIAPKTNAPFVVQSGNCKTEVLGTEFQIESYPAEEIFRLALVSGKVQVSDTVDVYAKPVQLLPGHQVTYHAKRRQWHTDTLSYTDAELYKGNALVFSNIPLQEALQLVAARFGYRLKLHAGLHLEGKRVTGVYKDQKPEELLQLILFISQYKFKIRDQQIEIYP